MASAASTTHFVRRRLNLRSTGAVFGALALSTLLPLPSVAQESQPAAAVAPTGDIKKLSILMVREIRETPPPLSLLDIPPSDDGIAGAKLAISDNNTTGRFLKQEFILDVIEGEKPEELVATVEKRLAAGTAFIIADVEPKTLLAMADAAKGKDVVIFNAGSPDEGLREENCRANVLHTAPSRAMLADALAQYLVWKQWRKWFLVLGPQEGDKAFADAIRRAAKRFGAKIVEERTFVYEGGSRRSDSGYEQVQQQIPTFTQNTQAHDVVVVADESNLFGEYLPYRTWEARPITGTSGLIPLSWHPAIEFWGGTQFQNRFKRLAGRSMRPLDYNVWMAVRSIGEAATRKRSVEAKDLAPFFKGKEFELAAFKGQKLTYRDWNGQLRQPIILATPKLPVTVSPQPGFLHQFSELDTLGLDKPETKCKANPG